MGNFITNLSQPCVAAAAIVILITIYFRKKQQRKHDVDIPTDSLSLSSSVCAACGKGSNKLKPCTACKMVKYCNVTCQKAHRSKHKKKCKRRVAKLHDEALFKQPPPREECPICMLPLDESEHKYQTCCGKVLCQGCIYAASRADNRRLCPFCRTPATNTEGEAIERLKKRAEGGDAVAINQRGHQYYHGTRGLQQDYDKAITLYLQAGELGCAMSYYNIGVAYLEGRGVERDMKKAKHYWELAAMRGDVGARHNLGVNEENAGNMDRAMKHYMISAEAGFDDSLKKIRLGFMNGHVAKNDFEKALRAHKEAKDEMKSDQRDTAAAARNSLYPSWVAARAAARAAAHGQN